MRPRQRLQAALNGEPTDRVPVWLLFPYHAVPYYVDVRTHPKYRPAFEASKQYAITLNRRHFSAPLFTEAVETRTEEFPDGEWAVRRETIAWKGRRLTAETRRRGAEIAAKKLLSSAEDLEFYAALPFETRRDVIERELNRQLPAYGKEKAEFPEELGAMMLDLGEPISHLYHASQLEEYAVWSVTHPDLVTAALDRLFERQKAIYRWSLENGCADTYFLVGSELAVPPLVGRETFRRWVVPYSTAIIEMIHAHGKKAIQHHHGRIREILPDFLTMNPDGLHTIEAPSVGDCTLSEAFEITRNRITLIGNVQYDDFRRLTAREMADAVTAALAEARGRRFILSPTAGPYDPDVSDHFIENYLVFMKTAWEHPWP